MPVQQAHRVRLRDGSADRSTDGVDDLLLLLRRDARPEREAEVLARGLLRLGEVALAVAEVGERRLEVERDDVVARVADPGGARAPRRCGRARASASRRGGRRGRAVLRELEQLAEAELGVARGGLAARRRSSRRASSGRGAAPQPAARRGGSSRRRIRTSSWPSSRGSAACGSAPRARRRRAARSGRRRRSRRGSSSGRS